MLLCPLEFERRVLSSALRRRERIDARPRSAVHVCGPGATGVRRWFEHLEPSTSPTGGVLLVGTGGGLSRDLPAGVAVVAERIVDADGRFSSPTLKPPPSTRCGVILALDEPPTTPEAKRRQGERSGAVAVDLESAAFAECCDARGWSWNVVRGISDGADHALPPQVAAWIDPAGRLRHAALLASLLRSPRTISMLPALRRRSRAALEAVAETIAAWTTPPMSGVPDPCSLASAR